MNKIITWKREEYFRVIFDNIEYGVEITTLEDYKNYHIMQDWNTVKDNNLKKKIIEFVKLNSEKADE